MADNKKSTVICKIDFKKHTLCHKRFLALLPSKFQSEDSNKLAIAYFSLASLELMNTLQSTFKESEVKDFIEYIYSHLIVDERFSGFRGSLIYLNRVESIDLASTCFALQSLLILKDDLSRVDEKKVMAFVKSCQKPSGGFSNTLNSEQAKDLRYCMIATTISKILLKKSSLYSQYINIEKMKKFIYGLQAYDGGFSMYKGDESHGGMVFCAIDALSLVDEDFILPSNKGMVEKLLDFLVHRQISGLDRYNELEYEQNEYADLKDGGGFNGRLNKYGDTCYVFWALASLKLLNFTNLVDQEAAINFLVNRTQNFYMGGFNKTTDEDEMPDPFHSFLGLAALSILKYPNIQQINCQLVIPESSYLHWHGI